MFTNPYSTTPCTGYKETVAAIRKELARARVQGELTPVRTSTDTPVEGVFEVPPYVKSIEAYTQPIDLENRWAGGVPDVVMDTRPFTRLTELREVTAASGQKSDWDFYKLYGRLIHRWLGGYSSDFKNLGAIAPTVFIRWLSGVIVSRLNLTPYDQVGVTAITGYYFYCLFLHEHDVTDAERMKIAVQVARVTAMQPNKVLEYIDRVKSAPMDINGYVQALRDAVESSRVERLSPALIYQMIAGHWWGAHARETISVALEYPPAFYAILFTAFTNKGVRRAIFAEQALKIKRGDEDEQFALQVARFIEV